MTKQYHDIPVILILKHKLFELLPNVAQAAVYNIVFKIWYAGFPIDRLPQPTVDTQKLAGLKLTQWNEFKEVIITIVNDLLPFLHEDYKKKQRLREIRAKNASQFAKLGRDRLNAQRQEKKRKEALLNDSNKKNIEVFTRVNPIGIQDNEYYSSKKNGSTFDVTAVKIAKKANKVNKNSRVMLSD